MHELLNSIDADSLFPHYNYLLLLLHFSKNRHNCLFFLRNHETADGSTRTAVGFMVNSMEYAVPQAYPQIFQCRLQCTLQPSESGIRYCSGFIGLYQTFHQNSVLTTQLFPLLHSILDNFHLKMVVHLPNNAQATHHVGK